MMIITIPRSRSIEVMRYEVGGAVMDEVDEGIERNLGVVKDKLLAETLVCSGISLLRTAWFFMLNI